MTEANMWATMRLQMGKNKHWLEATRHEDTLQLGIADVSFVSTNRVHGWMELKQIDEWPKRESTILKIDHYTDDQRLWLKRKGKAGGHVWLFVKVGRDYLLFDWEAAQRVGKLNKAALYDIAWKVWEKKMDWRDLGLQLCMGGI